MLFAVRFMDRKTVKSKSKGDKSTKCPSHSTGGDGRRWRGGGVPSEIIQRLLEEAFTQRACHFLFVVCFFVV